MVGAGFAIANNQDPWREMLAGAAGGALVATGVGAAVAAVGGGGSALAFAAGAGAGLFSGVAAANVGAQILRGEWATSQEMILGGLAGAIGGGIAGGIVSGASGAAVAGGINDFNRAMTTSAPPSGGTVFRPGT